MSPIAIRPRVANTRSVLFCADEDPLERSVSQGLAWTSTPTMCLSAATQNRYDAIILYIKATTATQAVPMIELCAALKKNFHTHDSLVLAVCLSVNRQIVERLTAAGVDFVVFGKNPEKLSRADESPALIAQLKEEYRSERVLARLCPYIHYSPIDADKELTTCRAYANWLVLGPRILRELCETTRHPSCPYYQNPKLPRLVSGDKGQCS